MEIAIFILLISVIAGEVWLFLFIRKTENKIDKALGGADKKSIMKMLAHIVENHEKVEKDLKKLFNEDNKNKKAIEGTMQRMGVVKFNPFKDMGGEHSFSIAFLDGRDNGVVITQMYSTEGSKVYAKQIIEGKSAQQLSKEEQEAIKRAQS
ncbi:MAG: DUF4446 family protein [Candidatus Spechtbacterales bacterium]|nr:DUF4446 family protein [Candidatus Spechtbacterales bacterium]